MNTMDNISIYRKYFLPARARKIALFLLYFDSNLHRVICLNISAECYENSKHIGVIEDCI